MTVVEWFRKLSLSIGEQMENVEDKALIMFGQVQNTVRIRHVCDQYMGDSFHSLELYASLRNTSVHHTFIFHNGLDCIDALSNGVQELEQFKIHSFEFTTIDNEFSIHIDLNRSGTISYSFRLYVPSLSNSIDLRFFSTGGSNRSGAPAKRD